jgi:hypothetical protein
MTSPPVSPFVIQGALMGSTFAALTAMGPLAPLGMVVLLVVGDRMLKRTKFPALAVDSAALLCTIEEQAALVAYANLLDNAPDAAARHAIAREHLPNHLC